MLQQPPVRGAGEHDRQPPCLLPGAAVLLLDVAAVARQALRAVPVAEVNTHRSASAREPHWSAVACGSAHGYWPDMLLMHSCETSVAASLVVREKAPALASSRCIIGSGAPSAGRRRRGR